MLLNITKMEITMGKYLWRIIDDRVFDIKMDNEGNIIVLGKI